ncbi:hypothetical protein KC19_2G133100 [Ceratodon purpureus]|uniref:Uncharacterized protein n=1 Tax=Ceratodon purpureus TaxID=3225 RepID=A0A8T0IVK6_CERPU|nr:hypothetical protein KC19_2G133100 [Ceratodon purpureus]
MWNIQFLLKFNRFCTLFFVRASTHLRLNSEAAYINLTMIIPLNTQNQLTQY